MENYLNTIQYAVENIIQLIHHDQSMIKSLLKQSKDKLKEADQKWLELSDDELSDDDLYDAKMQAIMYLYESDELKEQARLLKAQMQIRSKSMTILSGTLLHYAKQAISTIHGKPYNISANSDPTKSGNIVKTSSGTSIQWKNPYKSLAPEELRVLDLIVAGRNQSMHSEEGLDDSVVGTRAIPFPKQHNIEVFDGLHQARKTLFEVIKKSDVQHSRKQSKDFAINVVRLLKWEDYGKFKDDLLSINK